MANSAWSSKIYPLRETFVIEIVKAKIQCVVDFHFQELN